MSVAILVPVLGRPGNVAPLLESIAAATPETHRVLFIADPRDRAEHSAVQAHGGELLIVDGNYATKINTAVDATSEPLLFLAADDLRFHAGWLAAAAAKLEAGVGVVGTNDLGNQRTIDGSHSTHSLVTRAYAQLGTIDDPSRLLHEGYPHEFVDDELIETAQHRGAYAHAPDAIVEHLHPNWGKAEVDHLYARQHRRMRIGRRIYIERRPLWT